MWARRGRELEAHYPGRRVTGGEAPVVGGAPELRMSVKLTLTQQVTNQIAFRASTQTLFLRRVSLGLEMKLPHSVPARGPRRRARQLCQLCQLRQLRTLGGR